jgi:hypothetical protein
MRKSRVDAFIRCSIHVLPVAAAISLVSLNASQYYIGGELTGKNGQDDEKLAALQFTAKLHELLMLASIGTIVFTYIRRELAFGDGVPFGAIFAGLQFQNISLFWSLEFWGTLYAHFSKRRKKFSLIAIIVVCTILGVSVGPSTAVLMRPRLDYWPAGGTTFWINATKELLSPTSVDASPSMSHCDVDLGDVSCPYGDWQTLNNSYFSFWPELTPMGDMPESLLIPGKFSMRTLLMRQQTTSEANTSAIWSNSFAVATLPSSAIADGVAEVGRLWAFAVANVERYRHFYSRNDALFTTSAPQALTEVDCQEREVDLARLDDLLFLFPNLSVRSHEVGVVPDFELVWFEVNNETVVDRVTALLKAGAPPNLIWIDDPMLVAATSGTMNVIATFPETTSSEAAIYCCTIDSRLTPTEISTSRNHVKIVNGEPENWTTTGTFNPAWPRIKLTAAWARYLNPTILGQNATIFSQMASAAGMWNATVQSASYNYPYIVGIILSTITVNGLARLSYDSAILGPLKGNPSTRDLGTWATQMFPKGSLGWGGSIYDVPAAEQKTATMFTMRATINGYAYASSGAVQKAAMCVLITYSLMAIAHFIYSCVSGWSSGSWETVPEIAALAMNSRRTEALRKTGAGIATTGVYEERVWIRARDDRLEFVFKDTLVGTKGQYTAFINRNEKYG